MGSRVGLVGTVIKDTIHTPGGEIVNALGGILYTLFPLRAFLPESFEIVPILPVGSDLFDQVSHICGALPNVSTENLVKDPRENNRVNLYYHDAGNRTEIASRGVRPLQPEKIKDPDSIDVLLLNFISGWELTLSGMKRLSGSFRGKVFTDIHSLMLGRSTDGTRFPRKPYGWRKWLHEMYYVQMNRGEAQLLAGLSFPEEESHLVNTLEEVFRQVHRHGPEMTAVTLGAGGAFLGVGKRDSTVQMVLEPGFPVEKIVDPTGCGDVFLAAFTSATLLGRDPKAALSLAVEASALSTTSIGADDLYEYFRRSDVGVRIRRGN